MFTAERVALLLLALAVVVWAIVVYSDKNHDTPFPPEAVAVIDSVSTNSAVVDTTAKQPKEKNQRKKRAKKGVSSKKGKAKKEKQPAKQRDHLREPVRDN